MGASATVTVVAVFVSSWLGFFACPPEPWRRWAPSWPHHSVLPYDGTTPTTLEGTVTGMLWQNPHAVIRLDVRADGRLESWTVESEGASALTRLGWSADAVTAGSTVRVVGARARDGRTRLRCRTVTLMDGRTLPCF